MKRLLVLALSVLLMTSPSSASGLKKRKALEAQNAALKVQIDSLCASRDSLLSLIDSLMFGYAELDTLAVDSLDVNTPAILTQEQTDSLLILWYRNAFSDEEPELEDAEVERFDSNVPDSVLIRRLSDMNSFIELPYNETIRKYMVLYSEKRGSSMDRIMGLSNYYFPIFEEVFSAYGIPLELKYLAVVESHLKPTATSKVGAKGMWQFMYTPAKGYGLNMNSFVDERMDVRKSTIAAARYLRDAYRVFGDWSLAICSYNCGGGGVNKAIHRASGKRDFWSIYPYLPRETRGYVPAFVGAMYAMNYAKEYGIGTADVGLPSKTDTVEIRRKLHFKQISEVVGIPLEEIVALNPQYVHQIIPGSEKEPYSIVLPQHWVAAFIDAESDGLYEYRSEELVGEKIIHNIKTNPTTATANRLVHKVQKGDTLWSISKRYHVSVTQLRKWNRIPEGSNNIRVGQIIYIYR